MRSLRGWYQVILPETFVRGWVTTRDVVLIGNCGDLWLPSPTPDFTPTPVSFVPERGQSEVVVLMPVQVYVQPVSGSFVVQSVSEDDVLPVMGRTSRPETWYLVQLRSGASAWINASAVDVREIVPTPSADATSQPVQLDPMDE